LTAALLAATLGIVIWCASSRRSIPFAWTAVCALSSVAACDLKAFDSKRGAASAEPQPAASQSAVASASAPAKREPPKPVQRKVSAKPVESVKPHEDDPVKGKWTLEDATKGLPAGEDLWAVIETELGNIECKLMPDKAPINVANFVGLARGMRPWRTPEGTWEKKPLYEGTTFHRVKKGFLIQGGDPKGNGTGDAGYSIPDEVWEDANHDRAGLLCMANRGPNTASSQFFITDAPALHLDDSFTIFGECAPLETIHAIASVDTEKGDRPKTPPVIKKITVSRRSGESSASASASGEPAASAAAGSAASSASSAGPPPKKAGTSAAASTAAPKATAAAKPTTPPKPSP
jgi:peptidyl-prolyl cis-trans isomerase A (cyclophilin A)